ncbi:MAG: hypothetical protein HZA51_04540 [Planctomycetes bacterium]|nr:hypothetical protein [Planctomycetota bacterium]
MASGFRQFVVYTKVTALFLVFAGVLLIVFMNRNYKTNFWPGAAGEQVATLWLMGATGVVSMIAFWVFSKTRRVLGEWADLRKDEEHTARQAEQEKIRQSLEERERRIDDKLRNALGDEKSQP